MAIRRDGVVVSITPTVDTSAYSSGDVISTVQTISEAALDTKGLSVLRTVLVTDLSNQKSALDLLIFNQAPGAMGADNTALDISTTQLGYMVARVSIPAANYNTLKSATNAEAMLNTEVLLPTFRGSRNLYMQIVSRGTPTYASATALTIKLIMERY